MRTSIISIQKLQSIKAMLFNPSSWRTYSLFVTEIGSAGLLFLTTVVLTRFLGKDDFGVFAFYLRFTAFLQLFFRLGLFYGASLLLPQEKDPQQARQIVGASLLIGLGVGVAFSLSVFIFSFWVDQLFNVKIGVLLRIISPGLILLPMQSLVRQIDRGLGIVSNILIINLVPQLSYLILVYIAYLAGFLTVELSVIGNVVTIALSCFYIFFRYRPSFINLKLSMKKMIQKSKSYGIYAYFVELTDQATSSLSSILIPLFATTTDLGFYTLALGLVMPITKMSYSIGMVQFKQLALKPSIPKRILVINYLWLIISCSAVYLLTDWLVVTLFGPEYQPVAQLKELIVGVAFFTGAYQIYTFFLTAHEKRFVSYISIILFPLNLAGNYLLISVYKTEGAMVYQLWRALIFFVVILAYYIWIVKNKKVQNDSSPISELPYEN